MEFSDGTGEIIGAAIEVHRELGPSLLERIYCRALVFELETRGHHVQREVPFDVHYKGRALGGFYRVDLIVDEAVVVEVKAVDALLPVHEAQVVSYLHVTGLRTALLLNFRTATLPKGGIRRFVN